MTPWWSNNGYGNGYGYGYGNGYGNGDRCVITQIAINELVHQ